LLLPRAVSDWKTMQKMRTETASEVGLPALLGPFAAFDTEGRPLTLVTDDTRWVLPIMIHSGQMSSDLDYLGRLRKAVPSRAFAFVGVCDKSQCGDGLRTGQAAPGVPIVAYGSYAPLTEIARFDDRNELLLMNQFWGVKQSLRRPTSPEELAAEIQRVTGR
ncbi:MAG: hypothetical protein ACHP79_17125, partial [Terriglobales bacterium]